MRPNARPAANLHRRAVKFLIHRTKHSNASARQAAGIWIRLRGFSIWNSGELSSNQCSARLRRIEKTTETQIRARGLLLRG